VSIKVFFVFTLLSLAAVILVGAAVCIRIWWQMRARRKTTPGSEEGAGDQRREP